jgi:hypothetical protein
VGVGVGGAGLAPYLAGHSAAAALRPPPPPAAGPAPAPPAAPLVKPSSTQTPPPLAQRTEPPKKEHERYIKYTQRHSMYWSSSDIDKEPPNHLLHAAVLLFLNHKFDVSGKLQEADVRVPFWGWGVGRVGAGSGVRQAAGGRREGPRGLGGLGVC